MEESNIVRRARLGGLALSQNRAHMAEIGRRGGLAATVDRARMAALGRQGGQCGRLPENDVCGNCGTSREATRGMAKGRCRPCYIYRYQHGRERPLADGSPA